MTHAGVTEDAHARTAQRGPSSTRIASNSICRELPGTHDHIHPNPEAAATAGPRLTSRWIGAMRAHSSGPLFWAGPLFLLSDQVGVAAVSAETHPCR